MIKRSITLTALLSLSVAVLGCGGSTPSAEPAASASAETSTRPVAAAAIENAGLALVAPPVGFEERAGLSGRGPVSDLVLTGPFYGERALIAVCDGGSGEIAYAVEGAAEFTELLACSGDYGGSSRTVSLATGYLIIEVRGEAAMRWHLAVAERSAAPVSSLRP